MIYPVILCGGEGKRFGGDIPKQFQSVVSNKPMVIETALRYRGPIFENPVFVTNERHHDMLSEMIDEEGLNAQAILTEVEPRNTGPAIALALRYIQSLDPQAMVFITPSDHQMEQGLSPLIDALKVFDGRDVIACFGANPTYSETGYGYVKAGDEIGDGFYNVSQFIEKPNANLAQKLCRNANVFWNMGLFFGRAQTFINAYKKHGNDIWSLSKEAELLPQSPHISFDYAIMEKINNVVICPLNIEWRDIGVKPLEHQHD